MDQCAMASRTLLVNPKPEQIEAYKIAVDALDCLKENLVVDQPISKAYKAAQAMISEKNKQLSGTSSNFGFGIGFNFKEDNLVINAENKTLVKPGMTFHGRIAFTNVHSDPSRAVLAVGDTF
jgi:nucleosome binding factor SPN SPT16 subunit